MFSKESIEREVKGVFGDTEVLIRSDYLIGEDALTVAISTKTTDGRIPSIVLKLSGLEELQYSGDPMDLLHDKLEGAFNTFKHMANKEGTELVKVERK